jgi:hypothetical protein
MYTVESDRLHVVEWIELLRSFKSDRINPILNRTSLLIEDDESLLLLGDNMYTMLKSNIALHVGD